VPSLEEIASRLECYEPKLVARHDGARAAVAMLLRGQAGRPEVLFIERARHEGDPWSGHMAFPGGRVDPEDEGSTRRAAERETLEEVGVSLEGSTYLGQLDDLQGRPRRAEGMIISAHVYQVAAPPPLDWNHEVEEAFWFPLGDLLDEERHVPYPRKFEGTQMPGIQVGLPAQHIVWGLTYRFIDVFLSVVGHPLPQWCPQPQGSGDGWSGAEKPR
jgi:8-oxo-dGTP pyrophosphatase MutT (NUDIX family)